MNKIRYVAMSLFCIVLPLFGQIGYDRIFVVDISGSMLQNNLYIRVQKSVIDYIKHCRVGDRIILMTFGTDVNPGLDDRTLYESSFSRDLGAITNVIQQLKFKDDWTWMTKAFDIIGNRLKDLQMAYPDRPKRVYIFTDGINDPPPDKKDLLQFEDVLRSHFDHFNQENTYTYIIFLGVEPESTMKEFIDSLGIKPVSREREEEVLIQEITLQPPQFFINLPYNKRVDINLAAEITRMENVYDESVNFQLIEHNFSPGVKISLKPEDIECKNVGQKVSFVLTVDDIGSPGDYKIIFKPKPQHRNVCIDPINLLVNINLSATIIKITPKEKSLLLKINKDKAIFELNFENDSGLEDLLLNFSFLSLEPGKQLKIEPEKIKLPKGKSTQKFYINYRGFDVGNYNYNLKISCNQPNIKLDPQMILMKFTFQKPPNILLTIILVLVILIIALVVVSLLRINYAFSRWEISAADISAGSLNDYKNLISTQMVVGKDVYPEIGHQLLTIYANLKTVFTGDLFLLPKEDLSKELKKDESIKLNECQFTWENTNFQIKRKEV
ncbi:MAG: vWA domain-containing protein [bacterium]